MSFHLSQHDLVHFPLIGFVNFTVFRWLSLSCQQDQLTMTLSSSACPMMLCVRDRLLYLHQALSVRVFQLAWHGLADRLDQLIYQEVRKNTESDELHDHGPWNCAKPKRSNRIVSIDVSFACIYYIPPKRSLLLHSN